MFQALLYIKIVKSWGMLLYVQSKAFKCNALLCNESNETKINLDKNE